MKEKIIEDWNRASDSWFAEIGFNKLFPVLEKNPFKGFPHAMAKILKSEYPELKGKKICVPSCGDSIAAMSFCLLGADVTATDISEKQIENARKESEKRNLRIDFYVCDSMELKKLPDNYFDLVYTSNGVHVWIDNLDKMYDNFYRILRKKGKYIFFDTHPFSRPLEYKNKVFKAIKRYDELGPFEEIPKFHWRIQDFVNFLSKCGFFISRMEEFYSIFEDIPPCNYLWDKNKLDSSNYDWRINPKAALPQCLGLSAVKI